MNATANGCATFCDPAEVARAVRLIVPAGDVTEVRILDARANPSDDWPKTFTGYFDDAGKLAAEVSQVRHAVGAYLTINKVDPALLARSANRLAKAPKGSATSDSNITRRRWLLIDCDPERPAGISATDDEHQAAIERAQDVELYLHDRGWPDPIRADSGNGCHLLYRIDLPTDDGALVQRCLEALAGEFDADGIKIDTGVFNPSRICKLYGTLACKGDDTPDRPHRMSRIIEAPESLQAVPLRLLEELAGPAMTSEIPKSPDRNGHAHNGQAFDLPAFIARHNLDVTGPKAAALGATVWEFNTCPMCDHGGDGPFILRHVTGACVAGCHHDSCKGRWGWDDLRAKYEPKSEWKYDGGDKWTRADAPEAKQAEPDDDIVSFPLCEFVAQDHRVECLIDGLVVKQAGGGIFAKSKGQKTTIGCGTMFALATGTPALGKFDVPHARPCGIMSGESGAATVSETFQRIARAHGVDIRDVDNLHVSTQVPALSTAKGIERVERFIERHGLHCLALDPTYLAFAGIEDTQLSKMAVALAPLNGVIERTGCSIVLIHHNRKTTPSPYGEPTLEEIGGTGYSQWVRFWILLNKRREWDPEQGRHWLWFCSGSSAGFGHRQFLDVHEGRRSDPGGRVWDLTFSDPSEGQQREREQHAADKESAKLDSDRRAVCDVLAKHVDGLSWSRALKLAGVSERRWPLVKETMLDEGDVDECTITIGNQKTPQPGVKLASTEAA